MRAIDSPEICKYTLRKLSKAHAGFYLISSGRVKADGTGSQKIYFLQFSILSWLNQIHNECCQNIAGTYVLSACFRYLLAPQANYLPLQTEQAEKEKATVAATKKAAEEERAAAQQIASIKQIAQMQEKLTNYLKSNSKLPNTSLGIAIKLMLNEINSGIPVTVNKLKDIEDEFANIRAQAAKAGNVGHSLFDFINRAYQRFGGWTLITRSMTAAIRAVKQMFVNVTEINFAKAVQRS